MLRYKYIASLVCTISIQSGPEDVLKNVLNDYGLRGDRRGKAQACWYYGRQ